MGRLRAGAKRMLWFMAKYANGVAKEKSLGIRFKAILPMQIIGGTGIGDDASIAYAKAMGIERGPFLARFGASVSQVAVKSDSSAGRAGLCALWRRRTQPHCRSILWSLPRNSQIECRVLVGSSGAASISTDSASRAQMTAPAPGAGDACAGGDLLSGLRRPRTRCRNAGSQALTSRTD